MNRLELQTKLQGKMVKPIRLEDYDLDLHIRKFTALERANFAEQCRVADKSREADNMLEVVTRNVSAFVVSHGLCDEKGSRTYKDGDVDAIIEDFPSDALDALAEEILVFSKLKQPASEEIKNSVPAPSDSLPSDLPPGSDGGM